MDYRNYEIVLSPDLNISPTDFVTTWNTTTETHDIAEAHLSTPKGAFYDPTLIVGILITVGSGVATSVISDQINKLLEKRKEHKHTHIEHIKKADGTESFIVDIDE